MGHIGLTPQSLHVMGGFKVQGRTAEAARALVDDAKALASAGCFAIVLEGVPDVVAHLVTESVPVPTIGIGAGAACDGQVLVLHDLLGLEDRVAPKFVRRYASLEADGVAAVAAFAADVRERRFPDDAESYHLADEVADVLGLYSAARRGRAHGITPSRETRAMRRRLAVLAAVLVVLALPACGGSDDAAAPGTGAAESSSASTTLVAPSSSAAVVAPQSSTAQSPAPSSASTTRVLTSASTGGASRTDVTTTRPSTGPSPAPTTPAATTTAATTTAAPSTTSGASAPTGFNTVGLKIRDAGGSVHSLCLWLADTSAKREQGLMSVTSLGGKDGMIFTFDQDSNEQFWMFQTVMPLSIAFFDQAGELVSSTDMAPCPGASNTCPSYPAAGPYRDAIEVPAGALGSVGIGPESAIVARGQCPA